MALAPLASHTSAAAMRFPSLCKDALAGADHPGGFDREQEEERDKHEDRRADERGPVTREVPDQDAGDDGPDRLGERPHAGPEAGHFGGALRYDEVHEQRDVERRPHTVGETDERHDDEGLRNGRDLRADEREECEGDETDREDGLLPDAIGEVPGGDRTDDRPDKGGKKELEGVALGGAELVDGEAREVREDTAGAEPEDRGGEHVLRKLALGEQTAHVAADVDPHSFGGGRRGFGLSDPDGRHGECDHQDRGDENEDELRRAVPQEEGEEGGADLTEHVEDGEHGPDSASLPRRDEVGHERGVRVDGDGEKERVHREDDQHQRDAKGYRDVKERRRGERDSGDEERLASSNSGARPVGDCAHNWLREGTRERTLL